VHAATGLRVRAHDDRVGGDVRIAVEEILRRIRSDLCFPTNRSGSAIQRSKETIAGADDY
jgi:hypothetical protein